MHFTTKDRNSILTDYGHRRISSRRMVRNGWGERKMHRGFQALCKTTKRISSVFLLHHPLFSSAFFFLLAFFVSMIPASASR